MHASAYSTCVQFFSVSFQVLFHRLVLLQHAKIVALAVSPQASVAYDDVVALQNTPTDCNATSVGAVAGLAQGRLAGDARASDITSIK